LKCSVITIALLYAITINTTNIELYIIIKNTFFLSVSKYSSEKNLAFGLIRKVSSTEYWIFKIEEKNECKGCDFQA
jgi:hypothetical protein